MPALAVILAGCLLVLRVASGVAADSGRAPESETLRDAARGRDIPVLVYLPTPGLSCRPQRRCGVVLLSPGYGIPHTGYSFLANALTANGHLVVAVQHDLPDDPPLTAPGDLIAVRTPFWERGAENLRFLKVALSKQHPDFDWTHLILIGHSNGGDLSSFLLRRTPEFASTLITLDHRRVPLPRHAGLQVLSIRGSDFEADPGVLPSVSERAESAACITEIRGSRHNDMSDAGPAWLKTQINETVHAFLESGVCGG